MFPIPARVLFPAIVSLISGLWALAEWRAEHAGAALLEVPEVTELYEAEREARGEAERQRLELAERKLRLAEQREARLSRRHDGEAAESSS